MRSLNGFIMLARSLVNTDLWLAEKFTRGQAWVDLIVLARDCDGEIMLNNRVLRLRRGQVAHSHRGLSQRWQWSPEKVGGFLKWLEGDERIRIEATHVVTVITLVNYDLYQQALTQGDPHTDQYSDQYTETDTKPNTEQDTDQYSDQYTKPDRKGKGKGNNTARGGDFPVEMPPEETVLEAARTWAGDPSRGIPPGIPDSWTFHWLAHAMANCTPMLAKNWQRIMLARFRGDWVNDRFGARSKKAGPTEETGTKLLFKLKSQMEKLEESLKSHPGNPTYQTDISSKDEDDFLRVQAQIDALRTRIANLRTEV